MARGDGWPAIAIGSRQLEDDEEAAADDVASVVVNLGEELVRRLDSELGVELNRSADSD